MSHCVRLRLRFRLTVCPWLLCAAAASTVCTWTSRRLRGRRRRACAPSARAGSASGARCSVWARWARRSARSSSAASTCGGPSTHSRPPRPLLLPRLLRLPPSPVALRRHRHSFKHRRIHRHRWRRVLRAPSWPAEVSWPSVIEFKECFVWLLLLLLDVVSAVLFFSLKSEESVVGFGLVGAERRRRGGHRQGEHEHGGRLGHRLQQPTHPFTRNQRRLLTGSYGIKSFASFGVHTIC